MLVLDNSSYSINGDYQPTRLAAQADAVHLLFNAKLRANPENEVGLMVMAGKSPEVLVTPTQDEGKVIAALHAMKQGGEADLSTGIQVAQLALKHRQNKNQRQRVIVFVGSPVSEPSAALVKLGKKMKKNNVSIDIISFGFISDTLPSLPGSSTSEAQETNSTKLAALHEAVNSSDNSHMLEIEPGPYLLSDKIGMSAIVGRGGEGDDEMGGGAGGSGGGGDGFAVDPNLDPELAMALRMSYEEEQARQAAIANAHPSSVPAGLSPEETAEAILRETGIPPGVQSGAPAVPKEAVTAPPAPTDPSRQVIEDVVIPDEGAEGGEMDEEEELRQALALSRGDDVDMDAEDDDEEAQIAAAIALSMKEEEDASK